MRTNRQILWLLTLLLNYPIVAQNNEKAKTTFQTAEQWKTETDIRADAVMVYGTLDKPNLTFKQRIQSWKDRGYKVQFMTGVAWGDYTDYFLGKWDGKDNHMEEAQKDVEGNEIGHGYMIPYIVPTEDFIHYMQEMQIKPVIDAGITEIYLEEPEFWARGGYSEAFKREWANYYSMDWVPQNESPNNTYLSNKLKYHLYYNALEKIFTYAKEYGKSKGLELKCYVPTHSLVNYTSWQIVSPEASLASLSCVDGYIAQVWTGTSRVPVYYKGIKKERVFENAFLEYGCMKSMTEPLNREMYFLTDPIEDSAKDWLDYKINYQATFTAQLMYPTIASYEVMPWPDRIYQGLYKIEGESEEQRIPRNYSTQVQIMINSLNDIATSENKINGTTGIGVLMANSMMFQRFPTHDSYDDPQFSSFYGQTLPLLKRGVPVEIVHIENTPFPQTLRNVNVLVMSYSNMKPLEAKFHRYISDWVKDGGALIYCGEDKDPYQSVYEWWNMEPNNYATPSEHLFEQMGMPHNPESGTYRYGKGYVTVIREDPKYFVLNKDNDSEYFDIVSDAYNKVTGKDVETKNNFQLKRGPYVISAVMDESVSDKPLTLEGLYIDLFDSKLPVVKNKTVMPGEQSYLYDIKSLPKNLKTKVLCGASRVYDEKETSSTYSFVAKSPENTTNVSRVLLPKRPKRITIDGNNLKDISKLWDSASRTLLLTFDNNPNGVYVDIAW